MEPKRSLDVIQIAQPCPVSWDDMRGDERVRFCKHCSLHVYNLSDMSRTAAETLVNQTEGRLCVRFYQRPDGTLMTRDCGWRANLKRAGTWAMAAASVVICAVLTPIGLGSIADAPNILDAQKCDQPQEKTLLEKLGERAAAPVVVVGMMPPPQLPPPAPQPATQPATQPAQ